MNTLLTYIIIFVVLLLAELLYFRIADRCNIVDEPNRRSSHTAVSIRGGGIIFLIGAWIWAAFFGLSYPFFMIAVTIAAGISFADDVKSLPDTLRLVVQFVAMAMLILQVYISSRGELLFADDSVFVLAMCLVTALIVMVGATNIYNFMDGISGITAGYSMVVLTSLLLVNMKVKFMDSSLLVVTMLSVVVFALFNFRPKGKAKCFAGDVGSVGMAFIVLFALVMLIARTNDVTWLSLLLVYGVDGCLTICHRIMLHENLGVAHRKHCYQLMANELKMGHLTVSMIYMLLQLVISMTMIYLIPDTVAAHWIYLISVLIVLIVAYVMFMKKYYHLHEEYLASLEK